MGSAGGRTDLGVYFWRAEGACGAAGVRIVRLAARRVCRGDDGIGNDSGSDRRRADGKFLWPGFGENVRVLKWILERVEGHGAAQETPIGYVPAKNGLTLDG